MEFLTSLSESTQFFLQLIVVLGCFVLRSKKRWYGNLVSLGASVLLFGICIDLKPGKPAIDVILTILAVVVASATLQAAGGL